MIHGIDLGSYVVPVIRSEVVLATGIGLCQLAGKRFGKRANIARCEKIVGRETGEAVGGNIADQHRQVIAQSLEQYDGQPLVKRRQHKEAGLRKEFIQLGSPNKAGKHHPPLPSQLFQRGRIVVFVVGITRNHQFVPLVRYLVECPDEQVEPLLLDKPPYGILRILPYLHSVHRHHHFGKYPI